MKKQCFQQKLLNYLGRCLLMNNNDFEKCDSLFESLGEITRNYQNMFQSISSGLIRFQEVLKPISEMMNTFQENIKVITLGIYNVTREFDAIKKLGDSQFVYWNDLSQEFVEELLEAKDVDKLLREKIIANNYSNVNATIEECISDSLMQTHKQLFKQAVVCFRKGYYEISINGLTSIIDGLLSDISGNTAHNMSPRIRAVISKLKTNDVLDHEENALLILGLTFEKTINSFCAFAPFEKEEPNGLNRHWIAHWTIVNKKDTIFKYIFWERLDSLPIPESCFHFIWCQIA